MSATTLKTTSSPPTPSSCAPPTAAASYMGTAAPKRCRSGSLEDEDDDEEGGRTYPSCGRALVPKHKKSLQEEHFVVIPPCPLPARIWGAYKNYMANVVSPCQMSNSWFRSIYWVYIEYIREYEHHHSPSHPRMASCQISGGFALSCVGKNLSTYHLPNDEWYISREKKLLLISDFVYQDQVEPIWIYLFSC